MRGLFVSIACFFSILINADSDTFSERRFSTFYDSYMCKEKRDLSNMGLTTTCSAEDDSLRPPAPPFIQGLLPIVLVNRSGLPDEEVYIVLTGANQTTNQQVFVSINPTTGIGQLVTAATGDNAENYSLAMSQLPIGSTGRVIYMPYIIGGEIWISMENKLNMPVNGNNIVQPNFLSSSDPNYYTNFDIFEFAYTSNSTPNISADATAVSFHSLSLFGYLATATTANDTTGLTQSRSTVMNAISSAFATAPESAQWNNLFERNGGTILRVVSPGKGTSATPPLFDVNYLDNAFDYTFSYISDIWSGGSSFYKSQPPIKMTIPNGTLDTYHGTIDGGTNVITFVGQTYGNTVTFGAPSTSDPTTTFKILSGVSLVTSDTSPGGEDGVQLSKLFQESIIAGLVPTTNTLSNTYLQNNQSNYYKVNSNLTGTGQTTGPWYDLYSKALHSLGYIYTFAYDEPLWPQVQIQANSLVENATYLAVTINSIQ